MRVIQNPYPETSQNREALRGVCALIRSYIRARAPESFSKQNWCSINFCNTFSITRTIIEIMTSIYCKQCGERDPEKFYKGSRSLMCKECRRKASRNYYGSMDIAARKPMCSQCGEANPINFFPNSLKLCKCCTYIKDPKIATQIQSRENLCQDCGTQDPRSFYLRSPTICRNCIKKRKLLKANNCLSPACSKCGTTNPNLFYVKDPTTCRACKKKERYRPAFLCRKCGKTGEENFYKGAAFICAECYNKYSTKYYYPFYDELVEVQGGEFCYICKKTPKELNCWRLSVDHDHNSNLVRGLLCSKCNFNMAKFTLPMVENLLCYLQNPPALHLNILFPKKTRQSRSKQTPKDNTETTTQPPVREGKE